MRSKLFRKNLIGIACLVSPLTFSFCAVSCNSGRHIVANNKIVSFDDSNEAQFEFSWSGSHPDDDYFNNVFVQQRAEKEEEKLMVWGTPNFEGDTLFVTITFLGDIPEEPVDINFEIVFAWNTGDQQYSEIVDNLTASYCPYIIPSKQKNVVFNSKEISEGFETFGTFYNFIICRPEVVVSHLQCHALVSDSSIKGDVYTTVSGQDNKFDISISIITTTKIFEGQYELLLSLVCDGINIYSSDHDDFTFQIIKS